MVGVGFLASLPSPSHVQGHAGPSLSPEGRGKFWRHLMTGSAISAGVIAEVVVAARALLRVESGEDVVLARLAQTALLLAEAFLGAAVIGRPFEDVVTSAAGWRRLLVAPVNAIAGFTGLPADGAPFVLAVGAYAVDIDADGVGWIGGHAVDRAADDRGGGRDGRGVAAGGSALQRR